MFNSLGSHGNMEYVHNHLIIFAFTMVRNALIIINNTERLKVEPKWTNGNENR